MSGCVLQATGSDSLIHIEGGATNVRNSSFVAGMENGRIYIASGFTSEGCRLKAHEGKTITVGRDCMFSAGINISTTDFHSIISVANGQRVNNAKDIQIGNHVWLGRNVDVLKGAVVSDDVIVGMGSKVSGTLDCSHAVYVGSPAKKIKEGLTWTRSLK